MRAYWLFSILMVIAAAIPPTARAANGAQLFATNCAICHQADGAGAAGVAPSLRNESWQRMGANAPRYIASVLVAGLVGMPIDGQTYAAAMPPWAQLTDAQLSAVGTFVLQKLNGTKLKLSEAMVKETRAAPPNPGQLKTLRGGK
jgi:mono/diheme cytochrome c family protein